MITNRKQISEHFNSIEFACDCCNNIKIDENLVYKMENIFKKLNASMCIISSGYRCPDYDIEIGGFVGRHAEGLASDCCFYDKEGNRIPSKIVCCVAYDLGELKGIAKIDEYYVHLDNRQNAYYHGDEERGNENYWENPYLYFGVSKEDVITYTGEVNIHELACEVIKGVYGNGEERRKRLGNLYEEVQKEVNKIVYNKENDIHNIALSVINGNYGNGEERRKRLGNLYEEVQKEVNRILGI